MEIASLIEYVFLQLIPLPGTEEGEYKPQYHSVGMCVVLGYVLQENAEIRSRGAWFYEAEVIT